MNATHDILEWSNTKLSPWRQDALRRFASASELSASDEVEILNMIKEKAGFTLTAKAPIPNPLTKTHLATLPSDKPLHITGIRNIKNVNRLAPNAGLTFSPTGLTVIYGRNGSGKSGFVRIFRTACRTRADNPAKLKVLADVYGTSTDPQEAEIIASINGNEIIVPWKVGLPPSDSLLPISVFDSAAAQLYVDGGNKIQFLPFGLALPYKLNELCLKLRTMLELERKPIADQIKALSIKFEINRMNMAQLFYSALDGETTNAEIESASTFSDEDKKRLEDLNRALSANPASAMDIAALANWAQNLAAETEKLAAAYSDSKLADYLSRKQLAVTARNAANLGATELFGSEPLDGVGSETWRQLWLAARKFSIAEAYPARDFPVLSTPDKTAHCVLCQQPLEDDASIRLKRFEEYISGSLAETATKSETEVEGIIKSLPELTVFSSATWSTHIEQIRIRNENLAQQISNFKLSMESRRLLAAAIFNNDPSPQSPPPTYDFPHAGLEKLSLELTQEGVELAKGGDDIERRKLQDELCELVDRSVLMANKDRLFQLRNQIKQQALYEKALAELQTKNITQKANELVDTHLTKAVLERYEQERNAFEISHLKIGLSRKSDQKEASFQAMPGTTLTKLTSDILSEGEQRALALASFLTEIAITEGTAPVIIDDPVSSLDRERGRKVAMRIAKEAQSRQVIVFTHDLIFFNDLCREANELSVTTESLALFSDSANAGKLDPAGVSWKGQGVSKRLAKIREDFAKSKKLHHSSPTEYEFQIKHLYGRLRDSYERLVEEYIFCDVIRRGVDRIETQRLRSVRLSDSLAIRFHEGMTKANTHSHDNPSAGTVDISTPDEFEAELEFISLLIEDLKKESSEAEGMRPSMKPKKD
tara:strand:+ start:116 stop:2764 length:2649 start_codon:yes stop_codon:yes gene_type:complete